MTIRDAIEEASRRLGNAGVDGARQDAWILLAHACQQDRATLLAHALDRLEEGHQRDFEQLVVRRAAREPLAQIIGRKEFWSLDFLVTSDVLCPRPDSETLIEAALFEVNKRFKAHDWAGRILDLGTGSGCLLLTLLSELPAAIGVGVDISQRSLSIARSNAQRLGLTERVSWLCGDWGAALDGAFDLIISNPPYITESELTVLAMEVRQFEPKAALVGGEDGLDAYRSVVGDLQRLSAPGAIVCFEIGLGQTEPVEALLKQKGIRPIGRRQDLAGIDRCLVAEPP